MAETNSAQSMENAMRMFDWFFAGARENMQAHFDAICAAKAANWPPQFAQKPHFDSLRLQIGYSYGSYDDTGLGIDDYRPQMRLGDSMPHHAIKYQGSDISLTEFVKRSLPCCSATFDLPLTKKVVECYANPFSHCARKVTLAMEEYCGSILPIIINI